MIILSVCNHKGGTGKTTSAVHLAAAMGLSGYRVLVIDLDPQGFLTRTLGLSEPAEEASSMMLFQLDRSLADVEVIRLKGFDVLPASSRLTKLMRRLNKPTDVLWAKEALGHALDYHFILMDTAAAVTVYSLNALVASHYVVIPVTPEYQPIIGAEQTFQTVSMVRAKLNPILDVPMFLFTQVDARKRAHHRYRRYLRKRYEEKVLKSVIRTSAALSITRPDGTTVFEHDPYSRGARDYANATDELLRHMLSTSSSGITPNAQEDPQRPVPSIPS